MKRSLLALSLALLPSVAACKADPAPAPEQPLPETAATTAESPAAEPPAPAEAKGVHWYHDDYQAARDAARDKDKPIVIDQWAPWCHTCLSMKHHVLTDPNLADVADDFIWLAVDTDKAVNASVTKTFQPGAWPTFFVTDGKDEAVHARLVGSATLAEFKAFLARGKASFVQARETGAPPATLDYVGIGDRAAVKGQWAEAAVAYDKAIAAGTLGDALPDVLVARIGALFKGEQWKECAGFALAHLADAARTRSAKAADLAAYGHYCADHVDAALATTLRKAIAAPDAPVRALLLDAAAPLTVDDRSDGLRILRDVHDALGDKAEASALATRQRALLDAAVAKAPDARTAMTHNWPLCEVYAYLGKHAELVPVLQRSVDALPDEYDPPYRMAWLLLQAGRADEAAPYADKALALIYGPRKTRALSLLADIHKARKDVSAERDARASLVATIEALPPHQQRKGSLDKAKEALAAVGSKPAAPPK